MYVPLGKIERCVSDEDAYPALHDVYLRGEFLEATSTYLFARVPVQREPGDVDGPIPPLALELARKRMSGGRIDASKRAIAVLPMFAGINRLKHVKEPPTYEQTKASKLPEERPFKIALNPELLARIAEAFGGNGQVVLEMAADPNQPVLVYPTEGIEHGEAMLMPLKRDDVTKPEEENDGTDG